MDFEKIHLITCNFFDNSKLLNIDYIDSGLINKTYIIEHLINGKKSKFVLQCLSNIFESYEQVNINHLFITDHINNKIKKNYSNSYNQRWEAPCLIKCNSNNLFVFPYYSDFWRAMEYIDETLSFDVLEDKKWLIKQVLVLVSFIEYAPTLTLQKLKIQLKIFIIQSNI